MARIDSYVAKLSSYRFSYCRKDHREVPLAVMPVNLQTLFTAYAIRFAE